MAAGDYPEPPAEGQTGALANWKALNEMYDAWQNGDFTGGGGGGMGGIIDVTVAPYSMSGGTSYQGGNDHVNQDGHQATKGMQKAIYDCRQTKKRIWMPPGLFDMRLAAYTTGTDGPLPTNSTHPLALLFTDFTGVKARLQLVGSGQGATIIDYSQGGQLGVVTDPSSTNNLCGDPSGRVANFAFDVMHTNNTNGAFYIADLTFKGPNGNYGVPSTPEDRTDGWAISMGGRSFLERVEAYQFHTAAVYRMRGGPAPQDHSIDHNTIKDCNFHHNFYNVYQSYHNSLSGANSGDGDQVIDNTTMSQATKACRAGDPAALYFDSRYTSNHSGNAPFDWYSETGPQGAQTLTGASIVSTNVGTKTVVIDTNVGKVDPAPWGPFDNGYNDTGKKWNGGSIPPAFGFIPGDCIELGNITPAICSGSGSGIGMVTANGGAGHLNEITVVLEDPINSIAGGTAITNGKTISHHYNNATFLNSLMEYDGTYEGVGNANIFCPNRSVIGYGSNSNHPWHGLMTVDNNTGDLNSYAEIPLLSAVRMNLTQYNAAGNGAAGDVFETTLLAAGTVAQLGLQGRDSVFINTKTSSPDAKSQDAYSTTPHGDDISPQSAWASENPARTATAWNPDPNRIRGLQTIYGTPTDNGTNTTIKVRQTAVNGALLNPRTFGDGSTPGSAGYLGRVAGIVCLAWEDHQGVTFDISTHPPDKNDGGTMANLELLTKKIHNSHHFMLGGLPFYVRYMAGGSISDTEAARSECQAGDRHWRLSKTIGAIYAGDAVEIVNGYKVQRHQGTAGMLCGVSFWDRPGSDWDAIQVSSVLRASDGPPMPMCAVGVKSLNAFGQDALIAAWATATNNLKGFCRAAGNANDQILGHATLASTKAFTDKTVNVSVGTPGVVSLNNHGLVNGTPVWFASTGTIGGGIVANTPYYVVQSTANDFRLSDTPDGNPKNTTGTAATGLTLQSIWTTEIEIRPRLTPQ